MFAKLIVIAATLGLASAHCPNQCSGHGTCGATGVCTCYDNWGMGGSAGGDCSDRFCPYELAWVDAPNKEGLSHQYAECAAKGVCDRESGECACLAGYTGKACARQTCPDDCSGHGTCEFMSELSYGVVFNDYSVGLGVGAQRPAAADTSCHWDTNRARSCVCDSSWTGINCAAKICPHGNDYLSTRANTAVAAVYQKQVITLIQSDKGANYGAAPLLADVVPDHTQMHGSTFALTFTSRLNEKFTTTPIIINSDFDAVDNTGLAYAVKHALQNLPNRVIDDVNVFVNATDAHHSNVVKGALSIEIEFVGAATQGKQNLIEVSSLACTVGCTPYINGIKGITTWNNDLVNVGESHLSFVSETVVADFNTYECGRRGKCDSDTGICACFEGFTGEACSEITALV